MFEENNRLLEENLFRTGSGFETTMETFFHILKIYCDNFSSDINCDGPCRA